jgi:hypothetical protein
VRDGRRHHRRRYSRREFHIGLVCLAGLAVVAVWVAGRGARPDPALLSTPVAAPAAAPDRGPLPGGLAAPGWTEGPVSTFDSETLYEKIDGREGYYKRFGFERLWFVSLAADDDPTEVVDVEVYDLAETANALGAAGGERPAEARADVSERGLTLLHRNALYLTRGRFYIRAIGSSESPAVVAQLERLRDRLDASLEGKPLPWAWALFGRLGVDPSGISYVAENAFSFGFARDVYTARLPDETELFVIRAGDADAARELAASFDDGFASYGDAVGRSLGVSWTADRYISTVSGAKPVGPWTIGVHGAPDRPAAEAALTELEQAIRELPGSDS